MAAPAGRLVTLDAVRGLAVLGILTMNIVGFAMPEMAYVDPMVFGGTRLVDLVSWTIAFVLFDGKMRGLFGLLFGVSMLLIAERAEATGQGAAGVHYRRIAWLALFGLAHFYFIWWGDILFLYAVIGAIAFAFRHWAAGALVRLALAVYALGFIGWTTGMSSLFLLRAAASAPGADSDARADWADYSAGLAGDPADEIALHRSGWWTITAEKLGDGPWEPLGLVLVNAFETLPLMLLGMAFYRSGLFGAQGSAGGWERARMARLAAAWTLPGLAGMLALAALVWASRFDSLVTVNAVLAWSIPFRLAMVAGYAAGLAWLFGGAPGAAVTRWLAAAGRVAFSNYILTSLVMTFLFYGWGLGLFGSVSRAGLVPFVLGGWALMLAWPPLWLARFRHGPLEWLWRRLAAAPARREPA